MFFCLTSSASHADPSPNVNTFIFTHLNVHASHGVCARLLWFSAFDYTSEQHRNVHGPRWSMISHALDGWAHLRRPCAGMSGRRSALSIIPPAAEDTAELSPTFTPAVYSPSVFPSCPPPTRVEPVSLSACGCGSGPQLGGRVTDDIMPRPEHAGACECLMGVDRKWHLWSLWHAVCLTHPSSWGGWESVLKWSSQGPLSARPFWLWLCHGILEELGSYSLLLKPNTWPARVKLLKVLICTNKPVDPYSLWHCYSVKCLPPQINRAPIRSPSRVSFIIGLRITAILKE